MSTALVCDYCGKQYGVKGKQLSDLSQKNMPTPILHQLTGMPKHDIRFFVEVDAYYGELIGHHFCSLECLEAAVKTWKNISDGRKTNYE